MGWRWSGVNGVYHHVSRGHLRRCCDELTFRYEHRSERRSACEFARRWSRMEAPYLQAARTNPRVKRAKSGSVFGAMNKGDFGDWVCQRINHDGKFLMI